MKFRILLIDDSQASQTTILKALSEREYVLTTASSGDEGLACLSDQWYDLIILDYSLPDANGLDVLRNIQKTHPDIPVVMVTDSGSERIAVSALKSGASDYVVKADDDFESRLPHIIKDNLDKYKMRQRNRQLEDQLRESYKQLQELNKQLEAKVETRTEELERAYQLSNELMAKAVDSNMQLAELYSDVDESRRKLDAKIRILSLLNTVGTQLVSTLDRDELLKITIDAARQELGVQHCAILLLNEDTNRLRIGASWGTPDDLLLASQSLNGQRELLDILMKHDEPILIQDVEAHARFQPLHQEFPGLEGCIFVPLQTKEFKIGMFTVYGYERSATLTDLDMEFVSLLARQTALALGNILLTDQRIRSEEIGIIGKLTKYIQHELAEPMAAIRQATEILSRDDVTPDTQRMSSHPILSELERMQHTTQELMEFATGKPGELARQTCSVQTFVHDVVSSLQPRFQEQHIDIHITGDECSRVDIDVEKMRRVIEYIAENARESMPKGGTFTIACREERKRLHLELTDTGTGIAPDIQAHIFDPFVSDGKPDASGLGMTIVKKILDEHQAHINIQSLFGRGTTIDISLPLHQEA